MWYGGSDVHMPKCIFGSLFVSVSGQDSGCLTLLLYDHVIITLPTPFACSVSTSQVVHHPIIRSSIMLILLP
jgi:hypothetical protein